MTPTVFRIARKMAAIAFCRFGSKCWSLYTSWGCGFGHECKDRVCAYHLKCRNAANGCPFIHLSRAGMLKEYRRRRASGPCKDDDKQSANLAAAPAEKSDDDPLDSLSDFDYVEQNPAEDMVSTLASYNIKVSDDGGASPVVGLELNGTGDVRVLRSKPRPECGFLLNMKSRSLLDSTVNYAFQLLNTEGIRPNKSIPTYVLSTTDLLIARGSVLYDECFTGSSIIFFVKQRAN